MHFIHFRRRFFERSVLPDFRLNAARAVRFVVFHGFPERFVTHDRVVEMRNGYVEFFHGKIGKFELKIAERSARFFDNAEIIRLVISFRPVDIARTTPETAVRSDVIILAARCRLKMKNRPFRRNARRFDFIPYVLRDV